MKPELNFTVGATVLVSSSRPGQQDYLTDIVRMTVTQVILRNQLDPKLEATMKYRRDTGRMVGEHWHYSHIRIATNEDVERIASRNIRAKRLAQLELFFKRVHDMNAEQVYELHRILTETGYIKE